MDRLINSLVFAFKSRTSPGLTRFSFEPYSTYTLHDPHTPSISPHPIDRTAGLGGPLPRALERSEPEVRSRAEKALAGQGRPGSGSLLTCWSGWAAEAG